MGPGWIFLHQVTSQLVMQAAAEQSANEAAAASDSYVAHLTELSLRIAHGESITEKRSTFQVSGLHASDPIT